MSLKGVLLTVAAIGLSGNVRIGAAQVFRGDFSPLQGRVSAPETPFRQELCLNGTWQFQPQNPPAGYVWDQNQAPALQPPDPAAWDPTPIKIPSAWNVNTWGNGRNVGAGTEHPYWPDSVYYPSYPKSWDDARMGWLRRTFRVPAGWTGRRILVHFEAVAGDCQVLVNGKQLAEHFDTYMPFDVDVTDAVRMQGDNELLVGVRHHFLFNHQSPDYKAYRRPYPNGSNTENLAGIWQDVSLLGLPRVRVADVFVQPDLGAGRLKLELTLSNDSRAAAVFNAGAEIRPWISEAGKSVLQAPLPDWRMGKAVLTLPGQAVRLAPGERKTITLTAEVSGRLKDWSPAHPDLYDAVVSLSEGGATVDRRVQRFGWRQFKIEGDHMLLNGQKIQMVGDLCHPFGAVMMSRRFVWAWLKMIKDMGGNAVRFHAQPYPRYYLEMADEMGVIVLDETALFGSSICLNLQDPASWKRFDAEFDGLILRDRNHPSVVGWSEANEMFAMFIYEPKLGPAEKEKWYYEGLSALAKRAQALDPTREWVSCDGDEDLRGALPIWSKHLGLGLANLDDLPKLDKPQMLGESGGTYYAKPGQLSVFNGDRAYASYAGRNEALAIDLYQNVAQVARPRLAWFSPSEMVWFGLEHLPFGYEDFKRLPDLKDGVFFGRYREGQFGMQPERIPPYVATLNPGFDPGLPVYRPLAMFHAMKAAMAPGGPAPSPWDHLDVPKRVDPAIPAPVFTQAAFLGDRQGGLFRRLYDFGVNFVQPGASDQANILFVDGESLDKAGAQRARAGVTAMLKKGATVWILLRTPQAATAAVNVLVPGGITVTGREATALEPRKGKSWVSDLGLPALYFAENDKDKLILKAGLAGPWVGKAKTLLGASDTDWSQFNEAPEAAKCGAEVLYEHLVKPAGAALVDGRIGKGTLRVSSVDYAPSDAAYTDFWRLLLAKAGVALAPARTGSDPQAAPAKRRHDLLLDGPIQN